MKKKIILLIFVAVLLVGSVLAIAFTPKGDVNLQGYYKIINATGITLLGGNIDLNGGNITNINCQHYVSGGLVCSG